MRRWFYVSGMSLTLLGAFVLVTAAISKSSQADDNKQRVPQKEKPAAEKASFDVKVTPWGPTQEEIDETVGNLYKDPSVDRLLSNTQNRLISLEFIDPDDKSGNGQSAPDRFRATFYDYTNERSVFAVGNFSKADALEVTKSLYQPLPSPEEFDAAVKILQSHPQLGQLVTDKKLKPYQPMPPLYFASKTTAGRVERTINVGLRAANAGEGAAERENEVVAVNLGRQTVKRFTNGAPPTSSAAPAADCTPPSSSGSSTGRGVAGQYQFAINAQDGSPLWSFIAIRPSASSGSDGSAIELVDVKYKNKLVLKRAHVPILNVLYDGNTCGPYRDWQYAENTFNADPGGGTNVASGVRSCTVPATTILESNVDAGNHQGIAYYTEGDAVVLVTELSAGWYRYISEYRFHADGTIQPRFGMGAVQNGCTCNGHLHHVYWRFDFDINTASANRILETRGREFNAFAVPFEGKRYREKTRQTWIIDNSKTGDAWTLSSNDNDGTATGDAYGRGDLWFLSYSASEFEDSAVRTNTQANLDAFVSNQKLNNTDVVVWYGAHINHNRGMFNRYHDHSISGPLVAGPDIKPLRW